MLLLPVYILSQYADGLKWSRKSSKISAMVYSVYFRKWNMNVTWNTYLDILYTHCYTSCIQCNSRKQPSTKCCLCGKGDDDSPLRVCESVVCGANCVGLCYNVVAVLFLSVQTPQNVTSKLNHCVFDTSSVNTEELSLEDWNSVFRHDNSSFHWQQLLWLRD